jgi:hypothetical protein
LKDDIMAWVNWTRKATEPKADRGLLGIDFNAGRARAARGRTGRNQPFPLLDPRSDFPITISLEKKFPQIGEAALQLVRKLPHVLCENYLPALGHDQTWSHGRLTLTVESALSLALEQLQQLTQGFDGASLALPAYLTLPQANKLVGIAAKHKWRIHGTASTPLALAAERATHFIHGSREEDSLRSRAISTTSVIIVDCDDYALTLSVVRLSEEEVRVLSTTSFPRLGAKVWRERLLDAMSDRCIRLCRRDPRDSAEVEQMLFDQIDEAIDRSRGGQRVALHVRSDHWYQDLMFAPADLEGFCGSLCRQVADEVRLVMSNESEPPRAVWLTHDAGRLPGLANALHQNVAERTSVRVLHPETAAAAIANLTERWHSGELPRTHLDTAILLPRRADPRLQPKPSQPTSIH